MFFPEFGVSAEYADMRVLVTLDMPDQGILGDRMLSTQYLMTYASADLPGLKHGDALIVDGMNYSVVDVRKIDDGKLSHAELQRA